MKKVLANRKCPVCSNLEVTNLRSISINTSGTNLPEHYYISSCNSCGFIFDNTKATAEDYKYYYKNLNMYRTLPCINPDLNVDCYNIFYEYIESNIDKNNAILDIGCGSGLDLMNLKNRGYNNLVGLDPDSKNATVLLSSGIEFFNGDITDDNLCINRQFDVCILNCVLEHIFDIQSALTHIRELLSDNGKIVLIVPNALNYYKEALPVARIFNYEHINHFSPYTLNYFMDLQTFSMLDCRNVSLTFRNTKDETLIQDSLIFAIFEKGKEKDLEGKEKDLERIKNYFDKLEDKNLLRKNYIDDLKSRNKKVVVWGTGNFARECLENFDLNKLDIVAFIDNNVSKIGTTFCGYQVMGASYLSHFDGLVLICSMLCAKDIEKQIINSGYKNETIIIM